MAPADAWNLSAIVLGAQDAIVGHNLDGIIAAWNPAAEDLFGYLEQEALGEPLEILLGGSRDPCLPQATEQIRRAETVPPYIQEFRRKDRGTVVASVTSSPVLDASKQLMGVSSIIRPLGGALDGPGLHHVGDIQAGVAAELFHLSRLGAMAQMVSALSHELNQPLTAIGTYLTAAKRLLLESSAKNAPNVAVAVTKASEQANRAAQIIRRLRSFVTREDKQRDNAMLSETIAEAGELVLITARHVGVQVDFQIDADAVVSIDRIQIQQVLFNLMRNAIEAMTGSLSRNLSVSTTRSGEHIIVSVADTGPGVAPAVAARLFEPFVSTKPDGMGVGLSICRAIILAHDGELWLDPGTPQGATFRFRLPFAPLHRNET